MRLLIDSHILLWWLDDNEKLPARAQQLIMQPETVVFVSHFSLWEIQIKIMLGKLRADFNKILLQLPLNNFLELPSQTTHFITLSQLPMHHRDPFDRILIAQAISEPLNLLTSDKIFSEYTDLAITV